MNLIKLWCATAKIQEPAKIVVHPKFDIYQNLKYPKIVQFNLHEKVVFEICIVIELQFGATRNTVDQRIKTIVR